MVNRVVLETGGLKVSKAGYDVLTAAPENIIFDTYSGLLVHYTTLITLPTTGSTYQYQQDFSYPSLGYIPIFAMQYWTLGGSAGAYYQGWSTAGFSQQPYATILNTTQFRVNSLVTTTTEYLRIVIFRNRAQ